MTAKTAIMCVKSGNPLR